VARDRPALWLQEVTPTFFMYAIFTGTAASWSLGFLRGRAPVASVLAAFRKGLGDAG